MLKNTVSPRRWGAVCLVVFASACPGDDPSSCAYVGWGAAQESASATQTSTSGEPGSSSDALPTTTMSTTTSSSSDAGQSMGMSASETSETSSGTTLAVDDSSGTSSGTTLDPTVGTLDECMLAELAELFGDPLTMPPPGHVFTFVRPNGDDDAAGTPAKPKASIEAAIAAAQELSADPAVKKFVFLCTLNEDDEAGEFVLGPADGTSWPVLVPAEVSIVGGMYCAADVWSFPPSGRVTRVRGAGGGAAIGRALVVAAPEMPTEDEPAILARMDVSVESPDAANPPDPEEVAKYGEPSAARNGGSAIGVIVAGGKRDLFEVTIKTGAAGHGRAGTMESCEVPAQGGATGEFSAAPTDKCTELWGDLDDLAPPSQECLNGVVRVMGGSGGAGGTPQMPSGKQGQNGEAVGGLLGGEGGKAVGDSCNKGYDGKPGEAGDAGLWSLPVEPFGTWTIEGYQAESGKDGGHGANGSGGGGGGGSHLDGNQSHPCGSKAYKGAPGGSGGGGACGGLGGVGGGSGGSSTGVVSLAATLRILDSFIATGNGGDGGNAGCRQEGGAGGQGQSGGTGTLLTSTLSCKGGKGGDGGDGGFAGAGMGGHSIGIAYTGMSPVSCGTTWNAIGVGDAGQGGKPEDGAPIDLHLAGLDGEATKLLKFDP